MKKLFFSIMALATLSIIGCKKDNNNNNNNTPNNSTGGTPSPAPASGDGSIVAIKSVSKMVVSGFPVTTEIGTGVAVFGDLASGNFSDAGAVTLNSKALTKQTNNSYVFTPSVTDPTGIDFGSSINWSVAGAGAIGAFTHNASSQGFPNSNDISGTATTINSANNFTLSTTNTITNSDSVYFQISGPNATVLKRMAGNTSSVTFTAAELQTLGKGAGVMIIAPWNWTVQSLGGKQINVVNELALTRNITVE